jgi:Tfp pilus assembly pilus retraction ATPase PilT
MRGISIAIRLLPGHIPTIEELNLHPSLHDISKIKTGLVLICGGTGEGKTTTIAAIINEINKLNKLRNAHIVTLEDPIEYRFLSKKSFIEQREIGFHTPSFEKGLIDVLREDADVIVVGELREGETMRLVLNATESGHWSLPRCMHLLRKRPSIVCAMLSL